MTPELVLTIGREAMLLVAMLAGPLLLAALLVGLAVGFIQAATQINEMTLTFVPKLIALAVVLAAAGPWMLRQIMDYTLALAQHIPIWIS